MNKVESIKINKYFIIGMSSLAAALVYFVKSAIDYMDYQRFINLQYPTPISSGLQVSQHEFAIGLALSSVSASMIIIYFKKW